MKAYGLDKFAEVAPSVLLLCLADPEIVADLRGDDTVTFQKYIQKLADAHPNWRSFELHPASMKMLRIERLVIIASELCDQLDFETVHASGADTTSTRALLQSIWAALVVACRIEKEESASTGTKLVSRMKKNIQL